MKNLPARERPGQRVHGKYAMKGKHAYVYTSIKRPLDATVLRELHAARVNAFGPSYAERV
jgi:hypothetical protein